MHLTRGDSFRRCVHFALTRVLLTLPEHVFTADFSDVASELRDWVEETSREDPDVEVVRLALASSSLLSRHAGARIAVLGEW